MTDEERFQAWLKEDAPQPFRWDTGAEKHLLIRIPKQELFDYLYHLSSFGDDAMERNQRMEYVGIFCKGDGLIYDADLDVEELAPSTVFPKHLDWMAKDLTRRVRSIIEDEVDNDRCNLEIAEVTSPPLLKKLNESSEYYAPEKARKIFLYSQDGNLSFQCEYDFGVWSDDTLLRYIANPNGYAWEIADAYWKEKQEEMLFQFLWKDLVWEKLRELESEGDSQLTRIRNIMQAVNRTSAKTVTVTVCKGGVECTFKASAAVLGRDPGSCYTTWNLPAKDRKAFEQTYGVRANFCPEDIIRITYGGKTIYEAEPIAQEEEQDQGPALRM